MQYKNMGIHSKKKILIVDDEVISTRIIANHLISANYQVDTAYDGKKAWELLHQHPEDYALVFADRMMLGVDGMELLKRIKTSPELQHIPVIMITGQAEPEEFVAALDAQALDVLYKPIDGDLLLFITKQALEKT
jgi:two-component system cell cycle response regulator